MDSHLIIKDKVLVNAKSPKIIAGQKQELDVAFYLRRAFKDSSDVFIFNDYKFTFNGETAQIDHLILYPYGFILLESKSINGEVSVNEFEEWSRSYKNKWQGMASPIKQVELQQDLYKQLLHHNRANILSKLLNIKQQSFRFRCWDYFCVVSSNAIIKRENIPKHITEKLVKSEFIIENIKKVMNLKNIVQEIISLGDSRPKFTSGEMKSVSEFLIEHCESSKGILKDTEPYIEKETVIQKYQKRATLNLTCKKCYSFENLEPRSGKYGYYVTCVKCNANTAMKQLCTSCKSVNTKVTKRNETYTLVCNDCENQAVISI